MKRNAGEKKRKMPFDKLVMSVLILLVCVTVYLFTETGYGEARDASAGEAQDAAASGTRAADTAHFARMLAELGYMQESENRYRAARGEDLGTAFLTLHEENGFVYAFTLRAPMSAPEKAPKEDAGELEKRLYAIRQDFYAAELEWACTHSAALLAALDYRKKLSAPDVEDLLYYVRESAATGARKEKATGGIRLRAHVQGEGEERTLSVSAQQEDAYFK